MANLPGERELSFGSIRVEVHRRRRYRDRKSNGRAGAPVPFVFFNQRREKDFGARVRRGWSEG
jgi:hypothetical protein